MRAADQLADFFAAVFLGTAFLTAGRAAGFGAAAGFFTTAFDFGECGRVLPWLPA